MGRQLSYKPSNQSHHQQQQHPPPPPLHFQSDDSNRYLNSFPATKPPLSGEERILWRLQSRHSGSLANHNKAPTTLHLSHSRPVDQRKLGLKPLRGNDSSSLTYQSIMAPSRLPLAIDDVIEGGSSRKANYESLAAG